MYENTIIHALCQIPNIFSHKLEKNTEVFMKITKSKRKEISGYFLIQNEMFDHKQNTTKRTIIMKKRKGKDYKLIK